MPNPQEQPIPRPQAPSPEEILRLLRGDGKPQIFVNVAVLIASTADALRTQLPMLVGHTTNWMPLDPVPPLPEWMPLYRRHRDWQNALGPVLGLPDDVPELTFWAEALRSAPRQDPAEIRAAVEEMFDEDEQRQFLSAFCGVPFPPDDQTLRAMMDGQHESWVKPESAEQEQLEDHYFNSAAGQFYMRVWMPCWILHRTYPTLLLRQARLGDLDAFDKLLRLDKSVLADPILLRRWHAVMHNGSRSDRSFLLKAMTGTPTKRFNAKSIRLGLSGLISQMAKLLRCPVTSTEIRELFDGIERVRYGKDKLMDTNLPTGENLTKAIQRNRNWPSFPTT